MPSRIGKIPVPLPAGVDVKIDGSHLTIKGPKGTLEHEIPAPVSVTPGDGEIAVTVPDEERDSRALHGLTRTLVNNMVEGVTKGYEKKLEIVGTGYRVALAGTDLKFDLGKSHQDIVHAPEGITFTVESPTRFSVSGISKQQVGEVAANIRKLRKPEPYKGKGIRYAGEVVRRKVGKAGK
ncbi:MAG: 50S ribosomal protein L6 [Promicromonosporaceae bacterium]|nr:50S ribosomal protein L6 [Promicromonosporaceae bacterium]